MGSSAFKTHRRPKLSSSPEVPRIGHRCYKGLCVSTAERMILAGAEYVDPAISTVHGGEHGGMLNSEIKSPSECLPEAVATFAAVSYNSM